MLQCVEHILKDGKRTRLVCVVLVIRVEQFSSHCLSLRVYAANWVIVSTAIAPRMLQAAAASSAVGRSSPGGGHGSCHGGCHSGIARGNAKVRQLALCAQPVGWLIDFLQ